MSSLTSESEHFPPSARAAAPHPIEETPKKKRRLIDPVDLLKRFLYGVIGSCCFSAIMFFVQIKTFVVIVMAAVLTLFGWKTEPPKEVMDAGANVFNKVKHEAGEHVPPAIKVGGLPQFHESEAEIKARAEREAAARQRQLEHDRAEADALGVKWDADWSHEKFAVQIPIALEEKANAERQANDAMQRKALIDRATLVNLGVNPDLDLAAMEKQVVEAERYVRADAAYQLAHRQWVNAMEDYRERIESGPNAACPSCRLPLRLHTNYPTRQAMCSRCKFVTSRRVMLAQHRNPPPPKEPQPPNMNPSLLGKFFK